MDVVDLDRNRAIRKELESIISKTAPSLIMLNGHGNDEEVTGHNGETLVKTGLNENILAKRIIYALSCRSARILGRQSIASGAKAYIGYTEDFIFLYSSDKRTRPLEDKTAELFFEPSNQVMLSFIKGNDAKSSHENSKKSFTRAIQKLLTSKTPHGDTAAVKYLLWDRKHQVCLGSPTAAI